MAAKKQSFHIVSKDLKGTGLHLYAVLGITYTAV